MMAVVVPSSLFHRCQGFKHDDADLAVERPGRLVAQKHFGPLRDRAGNGDALLLTAGQLGRKVVHPLLQADKFQCAPSGDIGSLEISVTSETFSRAVRLDIRL